MTDSSHTYTDAEILISSVSSADINSILGFYEANLDTWKQLERFWDWRQNQNPYHREPKGVVAKENGKVVGCMSVNPVLLIANNRQISASWQQDSLVLKSMRGRGLGRKLIREANKGFELALAKGTSESMYALRKSDGYQDAPHCNYLVRVERPRPLKGRSWEGVAEYAVALWRLLMPRPRIDKDIEIREIDSFDPSFDELAASLANENILRILKTRSYLNWRYIQCPGKEYRIFRAGKEKAQGAIVTSITDSGEGLIVDLVCSSVDIKCMDALMAKAIDHFQRSRIARIWVFATLPSVRRRLLRFGFLPTKRTPRFTYFEADDIDVIPNIHLWDFWHGDGDIELYT